jgi:hypothetical protein
MAIQIINNGETGLTVRNKLNNNSLQRLEKFEISPDLDNVILFKGSSPIQIDNVKLYNGVTSTTYRRKLDDGVDLFTSEASLTSLNIWLAGLISDIDIQIEITTNPTEVTYIELQIDNS